MHFNSGSNIEPMDQWVTQTQVNRRESQDVSCLWVFALVSPCVSMKPPPTSVRALYQYGSAQFQTDASPFTGVLQMRRLAADSSKFKLNGQVGKNGRCRGPEQPPPS